MAVGMNNNIKKLMIKNWKENWENKEILICSAKYIKNKKRYKVRA